MYCFIASDDNLARHMSDAEYEYLVSLPLILHAPSIHSYFVHGGMLPYQLLPTRPYATSQPLAHVPPHKGRTSEDELRQMQEEALLNIPENQVPWNGAFLCVSPGAGLWGAIIDNIADAVLIFSAEHPQRKAWQACLQVRVDRVSWSLDTFVHIGFHNRENFDGKPWSNIWTATMKRCAGYGDLDSVQSVGEPFSGAQAAMHGIEDQPDLAAQQGTLPCMPSMIVYAHAATRGRDIKRWSIGIDTGCVSFWTDVLNSSII
jgi:hypothetical protein